MYNKHWQIIIKPEYQFTDQEAASIRNTISEEVEKIIRDNPDAPDSFVEDLITNQTDLYPYARYVIEDEDVASVQEAGDDG